ncbi:unnamed protein product [Bubo scandiacus]
MAASAVPAIPAPLTGLPFLKASHFQLGAARREAPVSHFLTPSSPLSGGFTGRRRPRHGQGLGSAGGDGGETSSETRLATGGPSCSPRVAYPHAHRPLHPCPELPLSPHPPSETPLPTAKKWKDKIPCGNRKSGSLHPSTPSCTRHRRSSPLPGHGTRTRDVFLLLKGMDSPITTLLIKRSLRVNGVHPQSQVKSSYLVSCTNMQLGDGCTRFSTLTSELFPVHDLEPVTIVHPNKYASSMSRGDEDPERNQALVRTTTTQLSYPETDRWNLTPKPELLLQKHQSNVCLGDECSGFRFFSTAQQAAYQPPCQSQRVMADSRSHRESHIPFHYHNESSVTTTQAMLVPHRQQKQLLSKDMLQQIKCSHLGLPWRTQNLFRTQQKEEFTPKSRGPAEIQTANSPVSRVPLGTLKRYCPQRKVTFTP